VPPPESARTSTRRRRYRGSCAGASRVAWMWSAAVSGPALPARSRTASAPGAFGAVISEDSQRVMAVGPLPPSSVACISSCAPSRATSSKISGSGRSAANSSSMWPRMRSVGDTRYGLGHRSFPSITWRS